MLNLDFFDMDDMLLGSVLVDTTGNPIFGTFYGFGSTDALIWSVQFNDVGHMVLDNVNFGVFAAIPEPSTMFLMVLGALPVIMLFSRSRSGA